jgi:hypothetical protein
MTKTYTLDELKKMKGKTDVDRFKKTSEKEIMEQSIADPDTPYLTDEQIKEFRPPKKKDED